MVSTTTETIDISVCANCGALESDGSELKTCNACKMARYCCRDCQVSHWPRHKETCKKRAAELFDKELFKDPPEGEECPICMLPLPFGEGSLYVACCGSVICMGCLRAQFKEDVTNGKKWEDCFVCAFCRTPATIDEKETIRRINKNVERNHARSIYQLATYHMCEIEERERDITKVIELFEKSGKLGHAESYSYLGTIYRGGKDGVERDIKNARHYLELGTIGGSISARCNLASLDLEDGDSKRAFKHFLICAKTGDAHALKQLKYGFKNGDVTKDEYAEALRAYQNKHDDTRSETRDEASGFNDCGRDWKRYYFKLKAAKGDISSMYCLACLEWYEGKFSRACEAFLHCAEAGSKPALQHLKIGVEKGHVTEAVYTEALRAYQAQHEEKSATRGEAPVITRVAVGKSKTSDALSPMCK